MSVSLAADPKTLKDAVRQLARNAEELERAVDRGDWSHVLDVARKATDVAGRIAQGAACQLGLAGHALTASGPPLITPIKGPEPIPLDGAGEKRFEALRAWRLERSRRDGLSPYIVAYDRSLRMIARERPKTVEALAQMQGWGPAKAEKYGAEVLDVLAHHP